SVEVIAPGIPTARLNVGNLSVSGGTSYTFNVTFEDDGSIDTSTLGNTDIRVTGPNSYNQLATFRGFSAKSGKISASYTIPAPGGTWNEPDVGTYSASMETNQVADNAANFVPLGALGDFAFDASRSLVVVNKADSGAGSLRQALLDASLSPLP